jgi:hypothetical protein
MSAVASAELAQGSGQYGVEVLVMSAMLARNGCRHVFTLEEATEAHVAVLERTRMALGFMNGR